MTFVIVFFKKNHKIAYISKNFQKILKNDLISKDIIKVDSLNLFDLKRII